MGHTFKFSSVLFGWNAFQADRNMLTGIDYLYISMIRIEEDRRRKLIETKLTSLSLIISSNIEEYNWWFHDTNVAPKFHTVGNDIGHVKMIKKMPLLKRKQTWKIFEKYLEKTGIHTKTGNYWFCQKYNDSWFFVKWIIEQRWFYTKWIIQSSWCIALNYPALIVRRELSYQTPLIPCKLLIYCDGN